MGSGWPLLLLPIPTLHGARKSPNLLAAGAGMASGPPASRLHRGRRRIEPRVSASGGWWPRTLYAGSARCAARRCASSIADTWIPGTCACRTGTGGDGDTDGAG